MDYFYARFSANGFKFGLWALAFGALCVWTGNAAAQSNGWANAPVASTTLNAGGQTYTDLYAQSYTTPAGPVCATASGATVANSPCSPGEIAGGDVTEASNQNFLNQKTPINQIPAAAVAPGSQAVVNVQNEYADSQSPTGVSYVNAAIPLSQFATASSVTATQSAIADALGGGASVSASGQLTAPTYMVQGKTYSNVGLAIAAEDAEVSSLATSVAALGAGMSALTGRVNAVQQFAYAARLEARQGIAGAMAMSTASMPSMPGRTSWVVNGATFHGETAFGGSMAHRFDTSAPFAVTGGFSVSGEETGARVGLAGEF